MNATFLFPHRFRLIGWAVALPAAVLVTLTMYTNFSLPFLDCSNLRTGWILSLLRFFNLETHDFTREVTGVLFLAGLVMIGFSKEWVEDERIARLRLESLVFAVLVNTLLAISAIVLLYGGAFLAAMEYNFCSTLIIFIARFQWVLFKDTKRLKKEAT